MTRAADLARAGGRGTMWIPAGAMYPSDTNGSSALTQHETTALRPDLKVLDFADGANDHAQFSVAFPKSWNRGTITFKPYWTVTAGTNEGTVAWALSGIAVGSTEDLDIAFGGTVVTTALAMVADREFLMVSVESGNMTIAGTPQDEDICFFQIARNIATDTQTSPARLLGIKIYYTTDETSDA